MISTQPSEKERFLATIGGGRTDRFPFFDLEPHDSTIREWRRQGLPRGTTVAEHFGLENHESVGLEIRSAPFYKPAPDLLDDPAAFDRRYDLEDPDRIPADLVARTERLHLRGKVVYVNASGGGLFQMLGVWDWQSLVAACDALVNRPVRVEELLERTFDFHCRCLDHVLSQVRVDYASMYEPIASNAGPLVSPAMFERFAMPGYRRVMDLLRRHGVPHLVFCTTGGDLGPLLPQFIDGGVDTLWISNIMTPGMEYRNLRREYGNEIGLIGGIDCTSLNRDEAAVREAVERTAPPLLDEGRYLPCLDDRPRDDSSFALYRFYRGLMAVLAERA